jgi:hypothetical protein
VKDWNGTSRLFEVDLRTATTYSLKTMISERVRIPPDHQRLIFAGKELEDLALLSSYGLKKKDCLTLTGRLTAGGKRARSTTGSGVKTDTQDKASLLAVLRADIMMKATMISMSDSPTFSTFAKDMMAHVSRDPVGWYAGQLSQMPLDGLREVKTSLENATNTPQKVRMLSKALFAGVLDSIATFEHQIRTIKGMNDGLIDVYTNYTISTKYMTNSGGVEWALLVTDIDTLITNRVREEGRMAAASAARAIG